MPPLATPEPNLPTTLAPKGASFVRHNKSPILFKIKKSDDQLR
tara:strand:- start:75 stop:203 length:129 start_codon:yes stop_codon:yes gene_type:complete